MTTDDRHDALELELFQIRCSLRNLEMAISPLTIKHIERICFISRILQPRVTSIQLGRFGSNSDGGYILAAPSLGGSTLSLGVGSEISTDLALINDYGHFVHAFDPFVNRPPDAPENFIFHKIGLKSRAIDHPAEMKFEDIRSIMRRIPTTPEVALIDIEGSEWDLCESFHVISNIKQIVIEFHGLDKVVDDHQFNKIKKLLVEITKSHYPVHVHANNDGPVVRISGAVWPSILEVTFLKKEVFKTNNPIFNFGPWPGEFDYPNSDMRPDLDLGPFFGVNAIYRSSLEM
jgi:hypothetical protein